MKKYQVVMNNTRSKLSSDRLMRKKYWIGLDGALLRVRNANKCKVPHPCRVFENVYAAKHGGDFNLPRTIYVERLQNHYHDKGVSVGETGFWRPKDRLPVRLHDAVVSAIDAMSFSLRVSR